MAILPGTSHPRILQFHTQRNYLIKKTMAKRKVIEDEPMGETESAESSSEESSSEDVCISSRNLSVSCV